MFSQLNKPVAHGPAGLATTNSWPVPQIGVQPMLTAHSWAVSAPRPKPQSIGSGLNTNHYPQWGNNIYKPPANAGGDKANNIVCYKCGQPGHMQPNCPQLKGNVYAAAVPRDTTPPTAGAQSDGLPPMEGEQEVVGTYERFLADSVLPGIVIGPQPWCHAASRLCCDRYALSESASILNYSITQC
jgi:Zinc knuckle